ncbi:hypothetical protein [Rhizobium chutanense]|uniref:hypothetical protein n=1 Tax=Rhizobium chutanense TaxID=2035448 RepID=UPI001FDEC483|nr:hypothetical protein [Rhizobium chutanense]
MKCNAADADRYSKRAIISMESKEGGRVKRLVGKSVGILLAVWLLPGMLVIFVRMSGFIFLPSVEWTSKANHPSIVAGLLPAAYLSWRAWKAMDVTPIGDGKMAIAMLSAPFFAYFLGKNLVAVALPMTFAIVAGHQVELSFTVANADQWGDSKCRTPVELEGLPFLFDTVCRVRDDVRMSLLPGRPTVVTGRGTSLGLFAGSLKASGESKKRDRIRIPPDAALLPQNTSHPGRPPA